MEIQSEFLKLNEKNRSFKNNFGHVASDSDEFAEKFDTSIIQL